MKHLFNAQLNHEVHSVFNLRCCTWGCSFPLLYLTLYSSHQCFDPMSSSSFSILLSICDGVNGKAFTINYPPPEGWIKNHKRQIKSWGASLKNWQRQHVEPKISHSVWRLTVNWPVINRTIFDKEWNYATGLNLPNHSAVNQQCDAAECLEMILNQISPKASEVSTCWSHVQEVNIKKWECNQCVRLKVFQGKMRYKTICSSGHSINEETNPFWTLPLSLKDAGDTAYSVVGSQSTTEAF